MKYIRTKEFVKATNNMLNEISSVFTAAIFMIDDSSIDGNELDNLGNAMTRLIDAWEELRKTPKEEATDEP